MPQIEIKISKATGDIQVEGENFTGKNCDEALQSFLNVGEEHETTLKQEYHNRDRDRSMEIV